MRPTIRPATSDLYREQDEAIDRDRGDDRLPIQVAVPIIVALSLSRWGGIGFAVSALL